MSRLPDVGPLHTIDTPNGKAHLRIEDVQGVLTTGVGQCTIIMRGGGAIQVQKPTAEVVAQLFGDSAATPATLKLHTA